MANSLNRYIPTLRKATNSAGISSIARHRNKMESDAFMKHIEKGMLQKPEVFEKLNSPSVHSYAKKPFKFKPDDKNILFVYVRNYEYGTAGYNNSFSSTFEGTSWTINGAFRKIRDCGYYTSDALMAHLPKAYEYAKENKMPFNIPKVIIGNNIINKEANQVCEDMNEHNDKEKFNKELSQTSIGKALEHLTDNCGFVVTDRYPLIYYYNWSIITHVEFSENIHDN